MARDALLRILNHLREIQFSESSNVRATSSWDQRTPGSPSSSRDESTIRFLDNEIDEDVAFAVPKPTQTPDFKWAVQRGLAEKDEKVEKIYKMASL